jgi:hypothetical protein
MKKILALVTILAVVAAIAAPLAVGADALTKSDNTEISANLGEYVVLQTPGAITISNMTVKGPNTGIGAAGSVSCNHYDGYNVTVTSNAADGRMVAPTSGTPSIGPFTLKDPLLVTTEDVKGQAVLSGSANAQEVLTTTAPGTSSISLSVSQQIYDTDTAANGYAIVLTYTASPNTP